MARSRPPVRDREALKQWRKALPGVPDDQIVIPRYWAKYYCFPPPNDTGEERDTKFVAWLIEQTIDINLSPAERPKFADSVKGVNGRAWRRAARWWDSLGPAITPLRLNQSLFTRRDKWKDFFHHTELMFCLALCYTWLDLPKRKRTAKAARKIVGDLYRRQLRCWLNGEIEPGVPDTRCDNSPPNDPEPPPVIKIDFNKFAQLVEETAATLPPEKREAYYIALSEGINRAEEANRQYHGSKARKKRP